MQLRNHSYKPLAKFFPPRKVNSRLYYLGVELEVEAPSHSARDDGLGILDEPTFCYAKRDGSLREDSGWELVTHPISRDVWLGADKKTRAAANFFKLVASLRQMGYSSHKNGRCGLHIHVSISAFGVSKASDLGVHFYWFSRLANSNIFRKLSQRRDDDINRWSRISSVNCHNFKSEDSRYVCAHIGEQTVEVRIFRGNMREDRIRKAIESVICAVEYSKSLRAIDYKSIKDSPEKLIEGYVDYSKNGSYPNLVAYLDEIGVKGGNVCA